MSQTHYAFLLAGVYPEQRMALQEAFKPLSVKNVTNSTMTVQELKSLMEHIVFNAVDGQGEPYSWTQLQSVAKGLHECGFVPVVVTYTRLMGKPLTESTLGGLLNIARYSTKELAWVDVQHANLSEAITAVRKMAKTLIEAEDSSAPHEPTEVDRIKDSQAREKLSLQMRQSQELLGAQQRELSKRAREKEQQIHDRERPREITK